MSAGTFGNAESKEFLKLCGRLLWIEAGKRRK